MRSGAPPFRNGRFANRPYEGKTITWLSRFHRAAIRNGTHICVPYGNKTGPSPPARLPAFAAARKETKKVTFELKRARLAMKKGVFFRRLEEN